MADLLKPAFRATSGLDAAGEKVINVAKADYAVLDDGVNVEFFIEENTLQQYDPTRGYKKDFAVIYDNRIWVSLQAIASPAGAFTEPYWKAVRTDPKWTAVTTPTHQLRSGDNISFNSKVSPTLFTLPSNPQDGDTIVLKDIGDNAGYNEIKIKASLHELVRFGQQTQEVLISKPFSYNILMFVNKLWQFWEASNEERGIRVEPSSGEFRTQAGDNIMRRYTSASAIRLILPKYANQGDIIRTSDIDGLGPTYHLIVKTFDNTSFIGQSGTNQVEFRTKGSGFFVYNQATRTWFVHDGDLRTRIRVITDSTKLQPNESIMVMGQNNMTPQTINIELPTGVANGDIVKIALNYMRKQQTVNIKVAATTTDKIATDVALLQFPKRSEYPPDATWVTVDSLTFNGDLSYTPVLELAYIEDTAASKNYWIVAQNVPTVERVDPKDNNTRKRLGVISLASQTEANVDYENTPAKEQAITPETLANRVAREDRRGITRIATAAQATANIAPADNDAANLQNVIMTPYKMDMRTATPDRKGVAETATQVETNAGVLDTHIVTPKTLNDRKATETLTGILALTTTGVSTVPGISRAAMGTNVYANTENTKAVTPKSLFENKATATSQGGVYLAIQSEVDAGATQSGFPNAVVTPETLGARRATDANHGLIEIATQLEVNTGTDYTRAVTPKTLNDRRASETLTGIAEIATQVEFDAGTDDTRISTPLKIKTRFNSPLRTSVSAAAGLVETGTLWDHYTLDIKEAIETQRGTLKLATQLLTDLGVDDTTAVTPLKLQKKKATESTEGIIQLATQAELVAGVITNKAFSPKHYKYVVQEEKTWEATPARRGYVKLTENALTWAGDNVKGSVDNLATFEKTGYAVSPFEMNTALSHYLPIGAKAVDADKFDGLDSLQFIRSDIAQTVTGVLTLTKETIFQAPITSTSSATFAGEVKADSFAAKGLISLTNGSNIWKIQAPLNGTTITFGNTTNVLTLNTSNGNAAVLNDIAAGNDVSAKKSYNLNSREVVTSNASAVVFGDSTNGMSLRSKDAGNIIAVDGTVGTQYRVLTEKNVVEIAGKTFVKKGGDNMTGRLDSVAAASFVITEADAVGPISDKSLGTWSAEITTKTIYDTLPGFMVPIYGTGQGGVGQIIVGYKDYDASDVTKRGIRAPGLLSQHGTKKKEFTYQIWTPRPQVATPDAKSTMWMRTFDVALNDFGPWGRVYTTEAPVTSAEIGAVSTAGSAFNNLTIRDWLQIGNVRIEPDPVTRAVKFTWIDNP